MTAATLSLRCRHCGLVLRTARMRITEEALQALRGHVHQVHPHEGLRADALAGEVLRHFVVEGQS